MDDFRAVYERKSGSEFCMNGKMALIPQKKKKKKRGSVTTRGTTQTGGGTGGFLGGLSDLSSSLGLLASLRPSQGLPGHVAPAPQRNTP